MNKWVLRVVIALGVLLAATAALGMTIDREHVASSRATYARPPEAVWEVLTDWEGMPAWRTGLERVEVLDAGDGRPRVLEEGTFGRIPMQVEEMESPHRLVMRIDAEDLGFGGTWTFELAAVEGGASLTITENGVIDSLIFRALARHVFGYHATQQTYLRDLGRHLGQEVHPAEVQ